MLIRIKNLALKAVVGVNAWEQRKAQGVLINIEIEFDGDRAGKTDDLAETIDYKHIKQRIQAFVESSRFFLLESLAQGIFNVLLEEPRVLRAVVEVDKPKALRFADSVSVVCSSGRQKRGSRAGADPFPLRGKGK
jgi:D-erythro-7,8-dihydroneopterin triphosphate epimerase